MTRVEGVASLSPVFTMIPSRGHGMRVTIAGEQPIGLLGLYQRLLVSPPSPLLTATGIQPFDPFPVGHSSRYPVKRCALVRAQKEREGEGHSRPGRPELPPIRYSTTSAQIVGLAIVFGCFDRRPRGRDAHLA